ncbi:MAG: hypothetical protein NTY19_42645 [Planctomycetota bacterium]|nr:hypothetical protein [Planctomycetota bacterium]
MPKDSNNIDTSESYLSDLYLLSIVVFHRRDLEMTLPAGTPGIEEPENERLVNVPTVYGNGELVLETRAGRPAVDLKLGQGEWVMLMAAKEIAKDYNNQPVYKTRFKWYRVLVVEPDTQATNSGTYQRNVTLFGQDWDADMLPTSMPQVFPQALLMNGVVAVYEKTIRLETSSLWTVQ